jgi:ATP-dependent helicase/nuclease subunit B
VRVLAGVAGSGKTHRILHEAAQTALANLAYDADRASITTEPLYIIVPEQHTLIVERQLLEIMQSEHGRRAYCGLQVTSFTRLGRLLHGFSSEPPRQLSDLGRQLIAWRLLEGRERQGARANELAQLLAELVQYGIAPGEDGPLTRCAELLGQVELEAEPQALHSPERKLTGKLALLAAQYREYGAWCERLGLQVRDWALEITTEALRRAEVNPQANANPLLHFSHARLWFDGFMGLTPPELAAAQALLAVCQSATLTLLLDPTLTALAPAEQAEHPLAEWYAPTLELLTAWRRACRDAGAPIELEYITGTPPRFAQPQLAKLAHDAGQSDADTGHVPVEPVDAPAESATLARAYVCATQRAEIDLACHTILELVRERGWRYREICVLARDVQPLQALLAARLADYGIPAHLDLREGLGRHPLIEYIKCALRLASGTAQPSDVAVLLSTGLLSGTAQAGEEGPDARELLRRTAWLVRQRQYRAEQWLKLEPWEAAAAKQMADGREQDTGLWQAVFEVRVTAFSPLAELARKLPLGARDSMLVTEVLALLWRSLLGVDTQTRIAGVEQPVLEQVLQLWDEFALLAQELTLGGTGADADSVSWAQFQQWLEFGLDQLSLRQPPLAIDHVIVSGVEEGRVPPVKAVLILGMSEDSWQPRVGMRRLFTDAERAAVNAAWQGARQGGADLLAPGDSATAAREPYLALVAATRAAEFVQLSYAALDRERKPRRPSRYYRWLTQALGITPAEYAGVGAREAQAALAAVHNVQDAAVLAAAEEPVVAPAQVLELLPPSVRELITWRRVNPADEQIAQTEYWRGRLLRWRETSAAWPRLPITATQLEAFAKCPHAFFATHLLGLAEPDAADVGNRQLGILYHNVLQRLLAPLAATVRVAVAAGETPPAPDWTGLTARLPALIAEALKELALDDSVRRGEFLMQRCQVLLSYLLAEGARQAAAGKPRWPLRLEAAFGAGQALGVVVLPGAGYEVELRGKLDRVDLDHERRLAVVDYKLGQRKLESWRITEGLELQLPVYLLALQAPSALQEHTAPRVWPLAQAEYQPIEPYFAGRQATLAPAQLPTAKMIMAAGKAEPPLDAAAGLLGNVARIITEHAEQIKDLRFTPRPVRSPGGKWRACQHCAFQALCRFDPLNGGRYRQVVGRRMEATEWQAWLAAGLAGTGAGEPDGGAPC